MNEGENGDLEKNIEELLEEVPEECQECISEWISLVNKHLENKQRYLHQISWEFCFMVTLLAIFLTGTLIAGIIFILK